MNDTQYTLLTSSYDIKFIFPRVISFRSRSPLNNFTSINVNITTSDSIFSEFYILSQPKNIYRKILILNIPVLDWCSLFSPWEITSFIAFITRRPLWELRTNCSWQKIIRKLRTEPELKIYEYEVMEFIIIIITC